MIWNKISVIHTIVTLLYANQKLTNEYLPSSCGPVRETTKELQEMLEYVKENLK